MTVPLSDPAAIYAHSFQIIRSELAGRGYADPDDITLRLVHASGMIDLVEDLVISPGALNAGRTALRNGAPIYCDAEMVAKGVIQRGLSGSELRVTLNEPQVPALANELGTTRSAAAVDLWRRHLKGAIVAIGNAPTALFRLLDGLSSGWSKPALIIGTPVGFVGAAESKEALIEARLGVPFVTIRGRRGGSALAAAAVNALSLGTGGDGT